METISVIVPAYNCEKTIERCLYSIIGQTYKNIQIIVINDGSSDNTESIVKQIQRKDSRINLISIPNSGVSHARNIGIDFAEGDYLTFVDSDDYIDSETYKTLIGIIKEYDVQIAHCSYKNVDENGSVLGTVGDTGKVLLQSHDEALEFFLKDKLFCEALWNKLYSKELFRSIRLDESLKINEDVLANFCLFDLVDSSAFIDKSFYSYVSNIHSVTHTSKGFAGAEQSLVVAKKIYQMSIGKPYEYDAKCKVARKTLNLLKDYTNFNKKETIAEKKTNLRKELKANKSMLYRRNDRIAYILVMYFPGLYRLLFKYYSKVRVKQLDPIQ